MRSGWGNSIVFSAKTFDSQSASLHPGFMNGWDVLVHHSGRSRNTCCSLMLWKLAQMLTLNNYYVGNKNHC